MVIPLSFLIAGSLWALPDIDGQIEDWWQSVPPVRQTPHYSVWETSKDGQRWVAVRSDRPTPVLILVAGDSTMRLHLASSTTAQAEYRFADSEAWLTRKYQYFVDSDDLREKFNRSFTHQRNWRASHGTQGRPGEFEATISASPDERVYIAFYTLRDGLVSVPPAPVAADTMDTWIRGETPERIQFR